MPKEYIGRIEALDACYSGWNMDAATIEAITGNIEHIPTADVVPVVRCRECQYWERYDNTAGCGYCHNIKFEYGEHGYVFHPVREPDFYCAASKRKDGGQDDV